MDVDMANNLGIKRVYEAPHPSDGFRVLVDRLWPRGLSREKARIDAWIKELAPSDALRRWFAHDPAKWAEFERRYAGELHTHAEAVQSFKAELAKQTHATLLYAAHDEAHNNALALLRFLRCRNGAS